MLVKLFSVADLCVALSMLLIQYNIIPWNFGVAGAFYLMIKFYMFRGDIASFIDLFVGIYIILLMIGIHTFLTYVFAIYLIQKGIFGLIRF